MDPPTDDVDTDPTAFIALTNIHKKPILDCCFSPEANQIVTAGEDTLVVLWNLPPQDLELHDETINDEHKLVCYRLSDHIASVMSVAMHKRLFLSASKNGQVKLWRLVSGSQPTFQHQAFRQPGSEPWTYNCHTRIIRSVCFSPDARNFATASDDQTVRIWSSISLNKCLVTLSYGHNQWIRSVRWSKLNDSLLASCGDDGKLCIWDSRTKVKQPPSITIGTKRRLNCLDWHPVFDHNIVTGTQESSSIIWDLRNKKKVQVYLEHTDSVNSVAFNPDGGLLLTGSSDKTSKIFDVVHGVNMFTLKSHSEPITSACFNSTGELLATASRDKTVTVWKRNFDVLRVVRADEGDITCESMQDFESDPGSSIPIDIRGNRSERSRRHQEFMYER